MQNIHQLSLELASHLHTLANELVEARLLQHSSSSSSSPASTPFNARPYLDSSAPLFAALHAANRNNFAFQKACKAKTQDARIAMDAAHLRLQNLKFEQNHLEREIRSCEEFESEYQNVPLRALSDDESKNLPYDPHDLMIFRLNQELEDRKRLDLEKKEFGLAKSALIKENEAKKKKLEELEAQLDAFVESARSIQKGMHAVDSNIEETVMIVE